MIKTLYPELAVEMVRHGESQRTLADLLNTSYNSIWRRLTGRTEWTISEMEIISKHYNKTYDELFKKNI